MVWELAHQQKKLRVKGQIWETTASTLIKELTGDTGAWENNMALFCNELKGSEHILFIRNLMELFEVGQYAGNSVSLADFMRNYIAQGEIVIISECTEEELARIELKSSNFLSFFQIIRLQQPPQKQLESIILQKVRDIAEGRHLQISEDAIQEVIRLHSRFVPYAGMPGRPIRFLESMLLNKKNAPSNSPEISRSEIIEYFCAETGMPVFIVDPAVQMNILKVRNEFHSNVFGQDKAVDGVVNVLASVKAALTRAGKPIASFLFVGPTGVGKTELAKVLAQFMFGNRQRMIRFDMSEFSDPFTAMRLIGSDYFADGLLTSAVRREPFCVLLFDEIEKAHPSFYDLLLQILSEGRLTDNQGKLVNFCSTIIIMTSNIGASALQNSRVGWNNETSAKDVTEHFLNAVQKHFRPELFNRIDEVIAFEPLDNFTIRFVVERELAFLKQREGIRYRRMDLQIKDAVLDYLGGKGYHPRYGARFLQRVIREQLAVPLAKALNAYDTTDQLSVQVDVSDQELQINIEDDPLALDLMLEELEKMTQANHAANLRRHITTLQDGNSYHQFLSELEHLESEKKHNKNFWNNPTFANRYSDFLQIKAHTQELQEEIEAIENALSMSSLGLAPVQAKLYDQMENWSAKLKTVKLRLAGGLIPESNVCFFAIYGTHLEQIVRFYLDIFQEKGFRYSAQSVWFREAFYNEPIEFGSYDEQNNYITTVDPRKEYIKLDCDLEKPNWQNQGEKPDDKLYGLEFTLLGMGVQLFLETEKGIHRWKLSDQFDHLYVIQIEKHGFFTPEDIHRREFYTAQPPRRIYEPPFIRDHVLKINRELGRQSLSVFLFEILQEHFEADLDRIFF
ncbi:MAG: ATP-dependent Clp protease ATP-binding subunit [Saprospiraceae bacterium]|nr:ATP-dependent Clp protease ATP-binding subunit [Saprospiraceae bacterium]